MQILTEWRIKVYTRAIVAVYVISAAVIFLGGPLSGQGLFDIQGKPLGSDFLGFFTAASLAKAGHAAWAYNLAKMHALEKLIISPTVSPIPWIYPPTFLLLVLPLAFFPYPLAIILWIVPTMVVCLGVVKKIIPHPLALWVILAFPGTFQNLIHFQNGFVTLLLLGWTIPMVPPLVAGKASFQIAPLVLGTLLWATARRVNHFRDIESGWKN
jgi:alpha-1,2-mannosyltransferase